MLMQWIKEAEHSLAEESWKLEQPVLVRGTASAEAAMHTPKALGEAEVEGSRGKAVWAAALVAAAAVPGAVRMLKKALASGGRGC